MRGLVPPKKIPLLREMLRYSCPLLAVFLFCCPPGLNAESGNAGQTYPVVLSSPDQYGSGVAPGSEPQLVWQDNVSHPGASYIALHFDRFDLAPGEKVVIHDGTNGQQYEMTGKGKMSAGTFWAKHIKGDLLAIELYASGGASGAGYAVDEYAAGYPVEAAPPPTICGTDDKSNAVCFAVSHTSEYARARSVARLLVNGTEWCTGFLVSTNNHLLTNQHCIENAGHALNTDYEFMSEAPACNAANSAGAHDGVVFSGGIALSINADLDYAFVQITNGNPAATYGHLKLSDHPPNVGDQIYVPQHAGGRAKEIAIFSSHANDTGGVCRVQSTTLDECSPSIVFEIGYYADTEGGSSGSPVISSDAHKVVALHHCGGCQNSGIPIQLIKDEIGPYVEDISVLPRSPVSVGGPVGGPFFPNCRTLVISNNVGSALTWSASTNAPWMEVHPGTGTVAAGSSSTIQVCINLGANTLALGTHTGTVTIVDTNSGETAERYFLAKAGTTDKLTEEFINDQDLSNTMLTFSPLPFNPYYGTCLSNNITSFPTDPADGTDLGLGDDDFSNVVFTNGLEVIFYGVAYNNLYVNSNGNITFTDNDTTFEESVSVHFNLPRVSLMFRDLSPNLSGTVSSKQLPDRVVITFDSVREFITSNQNSMQAEFFTNGTIRVTWLGVDAPSGIAGLSDGLGLPAFFQESDLSGYVTCAHGATDSDNDGMDDNWEFANGLTIGIDDSMHDDDNDTWFNWEEFVADTTPSNSASYFRGITNIAASTNIDLLIYPTSTNRTYDIEWNTNLLVDTWFSYSNALPGTGGDLQVELTNTSQRINFRSRVTVP